MKYVSILILLIACRSSSPKPPLSFNDVLKNTNEIVFHDSLLLDFSSLSKKPLDTLTGKKYWQIIYDSTKEMIYNADFFLAGKITSHPKLNILLLGIERSADDFEGSHGISQEIFLIVLDKKGNYKYSRDVSSYWDRKENNKITYSEKSNSLLGKDFRLMSYKKLWTMNDTIILSEYNKFSNIWGAQITENGFLFEPIRELNLDTLKN